MTQKQWPVAVDKKMPDNNYPVINGTGITALITNEKEPDIFLSLFVCWLAGNGYL